MSTTLCHPTHMIYTTFSHPILTSQRGCSSALLRRDFASWSQLKSYIHHSDTLLTSYIQHSHTLHSRRSAAQALQAAGVISSGSFAENDLQLISTFEFKSYMHHSDTLLTWHIQHSDILFTSQRGCSSATSRRDFAFSSQIKSYIHHSDTLLASYIQYSDTLLVSQRGCSSAANSQSFAFSSRRNPPLPRYGRR